MITDLSLVPLEDLFAEISKRTENVVISFDIYNEGRRSIGLKSLYKGDLITCLGLCELVKLHIMENMREAN